MTHYRCVNKSITQTKGDSIFQSVRRKYYSAVVVLFISIFTIGIALFTIDNTALGSPVLILVFILGNFVLLRLLSYKCLNCNQAAFRGKFAPSFTGRCVLCDAKIP